MSVEPLEIPQLPGTPPRHYGVFRAVVAGVVDPLNMGRIQLRVPVLFGTETVIWAVPAAPFATTGAGVRFRPTIGDAALVAFEAGDVRFPVVLGYFWTPGSAPQPVLSHVIRGEGRASVEIDDVPPVVRVQNGIASVEVTPESVTVTVGATAVSATPDEVSLTAPSISIKAAGEVTIDGSSVLLSAQEVQILGAATTSVEGGLECSVSGGVVRIN